MIQDTDRLSQWRRQRKRFEVLRELGPLDGRTILDMTCGEGEFYLPAAMLKTALRLTPSLRLAHDYLPGDFTLFLYKKPAWSPERLRGTDER